MVHDMKYVLNSSQMKACDLAVIDGSIDKSLELIDRASSACIKHLYNDGFDLTKILVVCGGGNNGADGFAIAKKLIKDNLNVCVVIPDKNMRFTKEALLLKEGMEVLVLDEFLEAYNPLDFTCIVDAVFGIGLSRDVEGKYAETIQMINSADSLVLSVDIPSGISSDNGCIMKGAVKAFVTVTFACLKTGQLIYPGRYYCGQVFVEDIGIPVIESEICNYSITDLFDYKNALPERCPWGNKGSFGKILVVAGSADIFGAAYLSAMAAYKSGCGMVHILTEKNNKYSLQQMLPEALLHFYDENEPSLAVGKLEELLQVCDCVCAGCGLGTNDTAVSLIDCLLESDKPMVLDADALNIIAKNNWHNRHNKGNCILTPHVMEMSRLSGLNVKDIKNNIVDTAKDFSENYNVVLVLKDAVTIVAAKGEDSYINRTGNCAMAKAGSGDVLAGIITGFLAQERDLLKAARLGVYIHGLIGDKQADKRGEYAVLARNLLEGIEEIGD